MARRPKNPINDIVDTVGGWLGGRGPGTNPQVSRVSRDLGRAVSAADTVTGGFGAAALRDVKKFQQGGSLPTNLAKTTAVNLAAGAAGAKAAQVAGRAVAATGVTARVANRVRGEVVLIHGSPTQGIKTINPTKGLNRGRGTRGVDLGLQGFYGVPSRNPQFGPSQVATKYALGDQEKNLAQNVVGQGSVYLAKAKKADLIFEQGGNVARTSKPARVVKELRLTDYPREASQSLIDDYVAALKRAGGPTVSRGVRKQSRGGGKNKK